MRGLIEIHTGFTIIGNIYIKGKFPEFPSSTKFPKNLQPYFLLFKQQHKTANSRLQSMCKNRSENLPG